MDRRLADIGLHKHRVADSRGRVNSFAMLEVTRLEFWAVEWLLGKSQIIEIPHGMRVRGSDGLGFMVR
jgi:hypothetical protein